jgi:hypothetical protein
MNIFLKIISFILKSTIPYTNGILIRPKLDEILNSRIINTTSNISNIASVNSTTAISHSFNHLNSQMHSTLSNSISLSTVGSALNTNGTNSSKYLRYFRFFNLNSFLYIK